MNSRLTLKSLVIDLMNKIILEDIKTIALDIAPIAQKLSGKTVLITGGAGFLGRHVVAKLYAMGVAEKNISIPRKNDCDL